MKASIVIPLYNQADYVAKAIESALAQKFFDFEVIVVNDGSTDGWFRVLEPYVDRVQLVNQTNRGLAMARNRGFSESQGEFILPLDADDWIEPDYLAKTVPMMTEGVGIVATDMQRHGLLNDRVPPRGLNLEIELRGNDLPVCSLIRREAFFQAGGYNPAVPVYEDWNLWICILKHGWKVAVVNEPLFHYNLKDGSMIKKAESRRGELLMNLQRVHPDVRG